MKRWCILVLGLVTLAGCGEAGREATHEYVDEMLQEDETNVVEETEKEVEETEVEQREGTTFRNAIWGDDQESVQKYETETELSKYENMLIGDDPVSVAGSSATVAYVLDDAGLLKGGMYSFDLPDTGEGEYISRYNYLKDSLVELYEKPFKDEIEPLERESLIETAGPATALALGYVKYTTMWKTDDTIIVLSMMSKDYKVELSLVYQDPDNNKRDTSGL